MKTRWQLLLVAPLALSVFGCAAPPVKETPLYGSQAVAIISRPSGGGNFAVADLRRLKFEGTKHTKKDVHFGEKRITTEQAVLIEIDPDEGPGDEFTVIQAAPIGGSATGYVKEREPVYANEGGVTFGFGNQPWISDDKWVTAGGSGYATILNVDGDKIVVINMKTTGAAMEVNCLKVPSSISLNPCEFTVVTEAGTNCSYTAPEPISGLGGLGEEGQWRMLIGQIRQMAIAADSTLGVCAP